MCCWHTTPLCKILPLFLGNVLVFETSVLVTFSDFATSSNFARASALTDFPIGSVLMTSFTLSDLSIASFVWNSILASDFTVGEGRVEDVTVDVETDELVLEWTVDKQY